MTFDQTVKTHWDRLKLHSDDYPTQQATNNTQRQCKTLEMIEKKVIEASTTNKQAFLGINNKKINAELNLLKKACYSQFFCNKLYNVRTGS